MKDVKSAVDTRVICQIHVLILISNFFILNDEDTTKNYYKKKKLLNRERV